MACNECILLISGKAAVRSGQNCSSQAAVRIGLPDTRHLKPETWNPELTILEHQPNYLSHPGPTNYTAKHLHLKASSHGQQHRDAKFPAAV
jgi:hypothetical protein